MMVVFFFFASRFREIDLRNRAQDNFRSQRPIDSVNKKSWCFSCNKEFDLRLSLTVLYPFWRLIAGGLVVRSGGLECSKVKVSRKSGKRRLEVCGWCPSFFPRDFLFGREARAEEVKRRKKKNYGCGS